MLSMRLRRVNENKKIFVADQDPKPGKTCLTCQNYFYFNYFLDAAFYTLQKTDFRATNVVIFHITFDFLVQIALQFFTLS